MQGAGIELPWTHQVAAAEAAHGGTSVVVATGTASGKSLAYLLPVLAATVDGAEHPSGRGATALYLSPTKALGHDQLRSVRSLLLSQLRAATYDGDTPADERAWVRAHASFVFTNPDMLHRSVLPRHAQWASLLRRLRYVVVDECHNYRGVFGSHVAQVLRRLRRVCAKYGSAPVFILASATVSEPAASAGRLTGLSVLPITDDGSPRPPRAFALWEPPLTQLRGENGAPVRRSVTTETADLLADLVADGVPTLAFVRSRRGAEAVALAAKRALADAAPDVADRVAAYRAGYLPEERRALEDALRSGQLIGLATTNALELGVDVSGLDAVLIAGWPGTRASLWQQAGRAGRAAGRSALAVLVARDDPLDTYLVHHPEAVFGRPVEATVLDPDNPYVLEPHLCAAAQELPLEAADIELFGPTTPGVLADLVRRGLLRHRANGWYWTRRESAADRADIRGTGGAPVRVVEATTGRLLGTVDAGAAHTTVHAGAVYLHQGEAYLVRAFDLDDGVALVEPNAPDWTTSARDLTEIAIAETLRTERWGDATAHFGTVEVTRQVVGFQRRAFNGEVLGEEPLELPPRHLRTRAVWWTLSPDQLDAAAIPPADVPGAAHAAEHAAIGLLPLFATCDRWDIGGVSTAAHADTGLPTIFVYDGHPGGAGFAERGYAAARDWLTATRDAVLACECARGCPSCVQSPKCGNGNDPLDKAGAIRLLTSLLHSG
jgi:DEAD/DEAH box helicase domain-containing protein